MERALAPLLLTSVDHLRHEVSNHSHHEPFLSVSQVHYILRMLAESVFEGEAPPEPEQYMTDDCLAAFAAKLSL
jgi:hypothetical protein